MESYDLKLNSALGTKVLERGGIRLILKLLLFLSLRGGTKQQTVSLILELTAETQTYLMHQVQHIQESMQEGLPLTEIYKKI